MSLWDQLKKGIDDAASSVNREAQIIGKQAELGKIEQEIERQYVEIGKCARELYRRRQLLDAEVGVLVKRIVEMEESLEKLRNEVQLLRTSHTPSDASDAEAAEDIDPQHSEDTLRTSDGGNAPVDLPKRSEEN